MWLGKPLDWQNTERFVLCAAATLSVATALLHSTVVAEHFEEWWGYGAFFLALTLFQGSYGLALLRWPRWPVFLAGIAGNYAVFVLYFITRTVGVPLLGPDAGEVEAMGTIDVASKWMELTLILALLFLLRFRYRPAPIVLRVS